MRMQFTSFAGLAVLGLFACAGCSSSTTIVSSAPPPASTASDGGDGEATAPGVDAIGTTCIAACGGEAGKKCASASVKGECTNKLCLVDLAQPAGFVNYCTIDCAVAACPEAYHCEDITSFGDGNVTRACVADPPTCGDGVKQLSEACDGPSAAGFCDACAKLTAPSVDVAVDIADLDPSKGAAGITELLKTSIKQSLPYLGDAKGCNAVKILATNKTSIETQWTFCYGQTVATLDATMPRDESEFASLKAPLAATLSVVDQPGAAPRSLPAGEGSTYYGSVKSTRDRSMRATFLFGSNSASTGLAFQLSGTWTPPPAP